MIRRAAAIAAALLLMATAAPNPPASGRDEASALCRDFRLDTKMRIRACRAALTKHLPTAVEADTLGFLAYALADIDDADEAKKTADRAVELQPDNSQLWGMRSQVLGRLHELDAAIDNDAKAIARWPRDVSLRVQRAYLHMITNRVAEALPDFDQALRIDPHNRPNIGHRIEAYLRLRRYDEALAAIPAYEKEGPSPANAANERCWVRAVANRDLDKALVDCNAALAEAPNNRATLDTRALVYFRLGKFKEALADYDASLRGRPDSWNTLYARGVTKLRLGDAQDGQADIDMAQKADPYTAGTMAEYGIAP